MKQKTDILQSLTSLMEFKDGIDEFTVALRCYDNSPNKKYVNIWQYILSCSDRFDGLIEDKRNVFRIAYGKKEYFVEKRADFLFNKLTGWISKFTIMKQIEDSGYGGIIEAEYYRKNGDEIGMDKAFKSSLEKTVETDESNRHCVNSLVYKGMYFNGKGNKLDPKYQQLLFKSDEELDDFYLLNKLKIIIEKLYFCKASGKELDKKLLGQYELLLKLIPASTSPLILLQNLAIQCYLKGTLEAYNNFKSAFFEKIGEIDSEKKYLLISLMNSLAIMPIVSKEGVRQEFLSLFKFGFECNIFLEDGELELQLFNNFVFVLHSLGEYDLLQKFIETHGKLVLDEKERINGVKMAECYLLLGEGKFLTALKDLYFVKPTYPIFVLRKYAVEFICIYERARNKQDAYIEIKNMEERYKALLYKYKRNKRINQNHYESYINLINFMFALSDRVNPKITKEFLTNQLEQYKGKITETRRLWKMVARRE